MSGSAPARDPHQAALIAAARRLGVTVEDLAPSWRIDAVRYTCAGRSAVVEWGRVWPGLSLLADRVCADKLVAKAVLGSVGVRFPESARFTAPDAPAITALLAQGGEWVCKPVDGTNGVGVALGIRTADDVGAYWQRWRGAYSDFMLERQIAGADLRLQAIGGALVCACVRQPAQVVGDGARDVAALAAARARVVRAANPQNDLLLDAESDALLAAQGLARADVPAAGTVVRLKRLANMSQGARAIDVTDAVHPRWAQWVGVIAKALDFGHFAVDAMTPNPGADPGDPTAGACVLEVNAQAQWLHHTFSEGRRHDIPALLLRAELGL